MGTSVHYADADEALDPIEADDHTGLSDYTVDEPTGCFGCSEESDACDRCEIVTEENLLLEGPIEAKPVVKKFVYERRKWFASEPPIKSSNEAKIYVFLAAPALRGKRRLEFA